MTTHDDLQRDMGRVEGTLDAMGTRLDRLEKLVTDGFKALNERLDAIEKRESERKGAWGVLVAVASAVGGCVAWLIQHFLK